jgi:hypothetical protein
MKYRGSLGRGEMNLKAIGSNILGKVNEETHQLQKFLTCVILCPVGF